MGLSWCAAGSSLGEPTAARRGQPGSGGRGEDAQGAVLMRVSFVHDRVRKGRWTIWTAAAWGKGLPSDQYVLVSTDGTETTDALVTSFEMLRRFAVSMAPVSIEIKSAPGENVHDLIATRELERLARPARSAGRALRALLSATTQVFDDGGLAERFASPHFAKIQLGSWRRRIFAFSSRVSGARWGDTRAGGAFATVTGSAGTTGGGPGSGIRSSSSSRSATTSADATPPCT